LGESFRIIIQSPITFKTTDIKEKNKLLKRSFEQEKKLLLNEPRGHRGINGCLIFPANTDSFELLFLNHDYSIPFKYEGVAAGLTALLETGNLSPNPDGKYSVITPYGRVYLTTKLKDGQVTSVKTNISTAEKRKNKDNSLTVCIDEQRYYKMATLPKSIESIDVNNLESITKWGEDIVERNKTSNPELTGVILVDKVQDNHFKSITFERDGYIRRTPGIDSTEAIIESFENDINDEEEIINETIFSSRLSMNRNSKNHEKAYYELRPFITGTHDFILDSDDPLPTGFLLQ